MGWTPDRKRTSTENSCFYSIEKLSCLVINDHDLDSSYSLNPYYFRPFSRIFWTSRSRELTTWIRTTSQVAGYALEQSVRGSGRRVSEPHPYSRQHPQPPRRGAAAPSRPQPCGAHGGAPRCRRQEDQPWRVVVPIPGDLGSGPDPAKWVLSVPGF